MNIGQRTRPAAAWAACVLAALALTLPLIVRPGPRELRAVQGPVALLELVLPGVLQAGPSAWLLPAGNTLLPLSETPGFRGHVIALLALFALCVARGKLVDVWRLIAVIGVAAFLLQTEWRDTLLPGLSVGLAVGAGLGLLSLDTRAPDDRGGPGEMLFGLGVVAFAAPLALIAIRAGATSNNAWVTALLPDGAPPSEAEFRELASALRDAFDFNALSAFMAMSVLLLHLKSRSAWSALVLLAVSAFELSVWPEALQALGRLAAGD